MGPGKLPFSFYIRSLCLGTALGGTVWLSQRLERKVEESPAEREDLALGWSPQDSAARSVPSYGTFLWPDDANVAQKKVIKNDLFQLITLWSVDCTTCERAIQAMRQVLARNKGLPELIVLAEDGINSYEGASGHDSAAPNVVLSEIAFGKAGHQLLWRQDMIGWVALLDAQNTIRGHFNLLESQGPSDLRATLDKVRQRSAAQQQPNSARQSL